MKKILLLLLLPFSIFPLFSLELNQFEGKQYILDTILETIHRPREPVVYTDYIIFTADPSIRYAGIAFDFEQYKEIHTFKRLVRQNEDNTNTESHVSFYILEIPQNSQSISYRLVMDGLWSVDPLNSKTVYDPNINLPVSTVALNKPVITETRVSPKTIQFIYKGESGQRIRLAGNFTNWDPFIYELQETSYGLYELELALPKGTYYYMFYSGINALLDDGNSERAYTSDGRVASVVTLQ